jgi:hypothetical protein
MKNKMKKNIKSYFILGILLSIGLVACRKYPFHYRTSLSDSLSAQRQHLYTGSRQLLFRKLLPQSIKVIKTYPKYVYPALEDIPIKFQKKYWGARFTELKSFEMVEYTKNDTIQEGYYIAKERNEIYYYRADFSISPRTLSLKKMPYDANHEAVKIVHKQQYKYFKKDYKYLITKARQNKKGEWRIKAFCYYEGKFYR